MSNRIYCWEKYFGTCSYGLCILCDVTQINSLEQIKMHISEAELSHNIPQTREGCKIRENVFFSHRMCNNNMRSLPLHLYLLKKRLHLNTQSILNDPDHSQKFYPQHDLFHAYSQTQDWFAYFTKLFQGTNNGDGFCILCNQTLPLKNACMAYNIPLKYLHPETSYDVRDICFFAHTWCRQDMQDRSLHQYLLDQLIKKIHAVYTIDFINLFGNQSFIQQVTTNSSDHAEDKSQPETVIKLNHETLLNNPIQGELLSKTHSFPTTVLESLNNSKDLFKNFDSLFNEPKIQIKLNKHKRKK